MCRFGQTEQRMLCPTQGRLMWHLPWGFPAISASSGSCGVGTTRGRCSECGRAVGEEVLACFGVFYRLVVRRLIRNTSSVGYPRFLGEPGTCVVLGACPGTVCTSEVLVVFLDTLTPVFELYVRAMRFECVVHAGRDSRNRLCDKWRAGSVWRQTGWTRLKSLNAASALDAISIRVLNVSFQPDIAEDALSSAGEVAVAPSMRFSGDLGFWRLVRRGNHVRTMLGVWACHQQGGFGVLRHLLPCLTLRFSAGAPKGVRLGPARCVTCRLWWLVGLHYSWLVVVERQLDLSSVTVRLRGSSCALLSELNNGVMNQ
ncbi:hypothetical protein Taro_023497 [Colocasia esculenta]|uniref:Uncharacterized protein n=1 Tax=Colocasia esculenta TaxID=4460 RepID=A0A843V4U3_COLES|nr:hypothetical protein [Colocasia esculenta]